MKRLLIGLLALLPLIASSAVQQYKVSWDPLPADQTVLVEASVNGGAYQTVGQAPGNATLIFSKDVKAGDKIDVRAWATKTGFPDSPRSGVVVVTVPLEAPKGVLVVPQ